MTKQYSIRDLANEFEITSRTLRFYEEKGLLQPQRQGQNRIYSAAERTRLRLILRGKRLGLTLDESSEIISMYQPKANNNRQLQTLINKIQEKKSHLQQQQKDLELMLQDLADAEQRCMAAMTDNLQSKTA